MAKYQPSGQLHIRPRQLDLFTDYLESLNRLEAMMVFSDLCYASDLPPHRATVLINKHRRLLELLGAPENAASPSYRSAIERSIFEERLLWRDEQIADLKQSLSTERFARIRFYDSVASWISLLILSVGAYIIFNILQPTMSKKNAFIEFIGPIVTYALTFYFLLFGPLRDKIVKSFEQHTHRQARPME